MLRARLLLTLLLFAVSPAAEAAFEAVPALEEPQAIDEEITEVRELTSFVADLVESGRRELAAREQALIDEENDLADAVSPLASLREARSHLDGLETRISTVTARRSQVRERLRLIEESLGVLARSETLNHSLRDVVRKVGSRKLGVLRDELASLDRLYGEALDVLGAAVVVAEDRLELAQSRLRVADFDEAAELGQDARTQLAARLIDHLLDQGLRLRMEASRIEPTTEDARARITQLEYSGELDIIRSNLRLTDLELFRIDVRQASVASIADDPDMPVHALHEARRELDTLTGRLAAATEEVRAATQRLASMDATLARRLSTAGEPVEALRAARGEVADLRQLAALQLDDITARDARLKDLVASLGDRIDRAEFETLLQPVALPEDAASWQRAGRHMSHLPDFVVTGLSSGAAELLRWRADGSWRGTAWLIGIVAAVVPIGWGVRRLMAGLRPKSLPGAIALPWLLIPPVVWLLITYAAGLRPAVVAAGLGLFALPVLLALGRPLMPTPLGWRAWIVVTISVVVLAFWLLVLPLDLSPAVSDLFHRVALLALAALAWMTVTTRSLDGLERAAGSLRLPLIRRLPPAAPLVLVRLLGIAIILIALIGVAGYTPLAGYLLSRLAGAVVVLTLVILALALIERLSLGAVLVLRRRDRETSAFWRRGVITPSQRILNVIVLHAGQQALVALFDWRALPVQTVLIAIVLGILPFTLQLVDVLVTHFLAPEEERADTGPASPRTVFMQRVGRAVVVIASALLVIALLGIDLQTLSAPASIQETVARALLDVLVILLFADLVWHTVRTMLVRKEHEVAHAEDADEEVARRRARLRTLLPIGRNILAIVILVTAVLMVLSSIGVEIGPLIAGAGVVGVAIGFGAQTLVKDIIAGVFFLLDDAFRIGEYIESGDVRGKVESFSLRSVKLRHHRGPLHTVPFGELGSITNYSRDWVIDKITLTVNPNSNISLIKKLVKQIGKDMLADPELSQNIIDPLKSQGVYAMREDGSVQVRLKITTKPGEQFVVRRIVYDRVKQAFAENGIEFFRPTVQVADPQQVAAHHAHDLARAAQTPAPA